MKTEYLCPECNQSLKSQLKACACGWQPAIKKSFGNGATAIADRFCQHTQHGQRCIRLGTSSPSTLGHGLWYCSEHRWSTHEAPQAEAISHPTPQQENQTNSSPWARRIAQVAPRNRTMGENG